MKVLNKVLNSVYFFWFAIFFSVAQLLIFIQDKSYKCLLLFVVLAFILSNLNKNLALSLFIALIISNFIFGCKKMKEGLENKNKVGEIKDVINLVKAGNVNTTSMDNLKNVMSQYEDLKKKNGKEMNLDMGSLNELMKFNNKISSSNLSSKDDVEKAVKHLRANKELLKNMIDKF